MSGLYALDVDRLQQEMVYRRCLETVSADRQERAACLHREEDRRRSIGAGWLLVQALRRYFGLVRPDMETAASGKPCVKGRPDIQFSLAHTGRWAVCAVDSSPVGVDAEVIRPNMTAVAKRFYTAEEQYWIDRMPGQEERDRAFARIWTRKEAYLKYTGQGIGGLASVSPVQPDGAVSPVYDEELSCWFADYNLPDGTPLTLCAESACMPRSISFIQPE